MRINESTLLLTNMIFYILIKLQVLGFFFLIDYTSNILKMFNPSSKQNCLKKYFSCCCSR